MRTTARIVRSALAGAVLLALAPSLMAAEDGMIIAPPFALAATSGGTVDQTSLDGRPYGIFFGFTHCPDVCPTTFAELGLALSALGDPARDFRVFFVSVDPARDDAATVKAYLSAFDPRIVGLSGPAADLEALADGFRVVARKVPLPDGGYTMEHTASVFLVDGNGLVTDRIAYTDGAEAMAAKIRRAIEAE